MPLSAQKSIQKSWTGSWPPSVRCFPVCYLLFFSVVLLPLISLSYYCLIQLFSFSLSVFILPFSVSQSISHIFYLSSFYFAFSLSLSIYHALSFTSSLSPYYKHECYLMARIPTDTKSDISTIKIPQDVSLSLFSVNRLLQLFFAIFIMLSLLLSLTSPL